MHFNIIDTSFYRKDMSLMSQTSIVLKNGTVLQHDEQDNVCVLRDTDILITGNRIVQIGQNLSGFDGTYVIDCTDKIVSPGLIDSHHHMWQTQLKGRHGDHTLLDYVTAGMLFVRPNIEV
jgi:cytosine/adenosine deaminase-related metal-dependent hydrolase